MIVEAIKTRIFREGDDLCAFITNYFRKIPPRSVIVITSKIVALAEGRTAPAGDASMKARLIRAESELAIPTKYVWLTIKDGMVMASAGIDESNAAGKLVLLPTNSFRWASAIRTTLRKQYGVDQLGVLITDSRTIPLRAGVIGVALGYAGFRGLRDYRGQPDIFGRKLQYACTDIADGLATAAVLEMGEGKEQKPLAIIKKASIEFCERIRRSELHIDVQDDMYRRLFYRLSKRTTNRL